MLYPSQVNNYESKPGEKNETVLISVLLLAFTLNEMNMCGVRNMLRSQMSPWHDDRNARLIFTFIETKGNLAPCIFRNSTSSIRLHLTVGGKRKRGAGKEKSPNACNCDAKWEGVYILLPN
jgi:hypothetical protein